MNEKELERRILEICATPKYGLEILLAFGEDIATAGVGMYPTLQKLEINGLVYSWLGDERPPERYYATIGQNRAKK